MTLRLTVDTAAWKAHVEHVAGSYAPMVPVVKGNGYGFGRGVLARIADDVLVNHHDGSDDEPDSIAVGTVHELAGLPPRLRPIVLTPIAAGNGGGGRVAERLRAVPRPPVVTVAAPAHVAALAGWEGDVLVKLASSMRRFGVTARELEEFERGVRAAGLTVVGHSLHLPLVGDEAELVAEVERWLAVLDRRPRPPAARPALWLSHLGPDAHAGLRARWAHFHLPMRLGTALWHGDKKALHLGADVVDVHTVAAGTPAGYWGTRMIADGTLVVVGAGSAHGVTVLADGRSPFHFRRRRLALVERPHMHTSMLFVPTAEPCPGIGDIVDVQQPLISVAVDELRWGS